MANVEPGEVMHFLDDLRLTKYEKLAYLNLVINGAQHYKSLVRNSGIPYGKIYAIMNALELKGFVTISSGRPKRFRAVNPQTVLDQHYVDLRQALDDYLERSRRILAVLLPLYEQTRMTAQPCKGLDDFQRVLAQNV
jgi:sugar-specific transcriptional regulator TrmB